MVNTVSHGNYSFYDPVEMLKQNRTHFEKVLDDFLAFYPFNRAELAGNGEQGQKTTAPESLVVQTEVKPAAQAGQGR